MPRAAILTALPVEYLAVRAHLSDLQEKIHPQGTIYERGQFAANGQVWDVGLVEIGAGNAGAALEAERAIAYFSPDVLLFVGVAGGIKDVAIGDVVASTKIYGYESGKAELKFKPRPEIGLSAYNLEQRARAVARKGDWLQGLTAGLALTPRAFVAPIAAGEKVIASTKSEVFQFLRQNYGDAIAVEMEGLGFLEAARANQQVSAMVIRGISDLIDGKGQADQSGFQEMAARHASVFAFAMLANLKLAEASARGSVEEPRQEGMEQTNSGPAKGWQTVVQGGTAYIAEEIHIHEATAENPPPGNPRILPKPAYKLHLIPRQVRYFFAGRSPVLDELRQLFESAESKSVAISGLPGIGKTYIANQYVYKYREFYSYIFWINSDSSQNIITDFAKIAKNLNLTKDDKDQNLSVSLLKQWFEKNLDWLLVFDNADDWNMINEYLPHREKGHILLTTRTASVPIMAEQLKIPAMQPEEGALFLLRCARKLKESETLIQASKIDQQKAKAISQRVGGLTLALNQAGAYMNEMKIDPERYLKLYDSEEGSDLRGEAGEVVDHTSVSITFSLAFKQIAKRSPTAIDFLRVCAFLTPDAIPEEIFLNKGATQLGTNLASLESKSMAFDKVIKQAMRFSLIQRNDANKTFDIHRVVQEILRDEMSPETQSMWIERIARALYQDLPSPDDRTSWSVCNDLLPHIVTVGGYLRSYQIYFPEAAYLLNQSGQHLFNRAQYKAAISCYKQASLIWWKLSGQITVDMIECLNNLVEAYEIIGRYTKARPLAKRAINLAKNYQEQHPDLLARGLYNLAMLDESEGEYSQAVSHYEQSLSIRRELLGDQHLSVAQTLNNLANVFSRQGNYAQAEISGQEALKIRERLMGLSSLEVAESKSNLGLFYIEQEKHQKGEKLVRQAMALREQILGDKHPKVAHSLNALGSMYLEQGNYSNAELNFLRVIEIWENFLGKSHPDVATAKDNLGVSYTGQGTFDKAEQFFREALEIRERVLPLNHPDIAESYLSFAHLYKRKEVYDKAEFFCRKALKIYQEIPDLNRQYLADLWKFYAKGILQNLSREEESELIIALLEEDRIPTISV